MKSSLSHITLLLFSTFFPYILSSKHTTNFIKSSCTSTTTYPTLCYSTLSLYASEIRTNPKALATKSLYIALTDARSTSRSMGHLMRIRGLRPEETSALSVCNMAVRYSGDQLQRAFEEMGQGPVSGPTSEMVVSNVLTWTSAALTYEGNCMDGFKGRETNGNVKIMVTRRVEKLTELTSNALALVNGYHHHHNSNP